MTDAPKVPAWIEAMVEAGARALCQTRAKMEGRAGCITALCGQCEAEARAALAAALRNNPLANLPFRYVAGYDETCGPFELEPIIEVWSLRMVAAAIERLGAPEKPEGGT